MTAAPLNGTDRRRPPKPATAAGRRPPPRTPVDLINLAELVVASPGTISELARGRRPTGTRSAFHPPLRQDRAGFGFDQAVVAPMDHSQ